MHVAEHGELHYSWEDGKAPLPIASSKAAATAYKIASSPAVNSEHNRDASNLHNDNPQLPEASLSDPGNAEQALKEESALNHRQPDEAGKASRESLFQSKGWHTTTASPVWQVVMSICGVCLLKGDLKAMCA